jgi:hypothetical protein
MHLGIVHQTCPLPIVKYGANHEPKLQQIVRHRRSYTYYLKVGGITRLQVGARSLLISMRDIHTHKMPPIYTLKILQMLYV